jgi:zinc D-Ala-D-Ala carboxypeptidase
MARIETIRSQVAMPSGSFHDALSAQMAAPGTVSPTAAANRTPLGPAPAGPALGIGAGIGEGVGLGPAVGPAWGATSTGIASAAQLDDYLRSHSIEDRNGRLDPSEVTPVSGGWDGRDMALLAPAAESWEAMRADAARSGIDLRMIDAYRSWEVQAGAYEDYLAGRKKANVLPPGTSEHGNGLAVDVTNGAIIDTSDPEWAWLRDNAQRYGWYPISNESWHWEFRGI